MNPANDDYLAFLQGKAVMAPARGLLDIPALSDRLFGYQRASVAFMLRAGGAGLFLDTGLGKTLCELEFSRHAAEASNGKALILTPLAVAWQIAEEGKRFGYDARVIRDQGEARQGINICNYDRLERLDPSAFGSIALDESSILKSFTGKTTRALIAAFAAQRFKLGATATPAPNDHMEIGQHAEFLGVMPSNEMLMRWFMADQTQMGRYRLKGHAIESFWDWMASWARMASLPSDLGDSDAGFVLPALKVIRHRIAGEAPIIGDGLFGALEVSATTMHDIKRQTAVGSSRVDLQACKLEYSIVSPK